MSRPPAITAKHLTLDTFSHADIDALADTLAEPDVTKSITANGCTCQLDASYRLAQWDGRGYGMLGGANVAAPPDPLIGWCGFAAPVPLNFP